MEFIKQLSCYVGDSGLAVPYVPHVTELQFDISLRSGALRSEYSLSTPGVYNASG